MSMESRKHMVVSYGRVRALGSGSQLETEYCFQGARPSGVSCWVLAEVL